MPFYRDKLESVGITPDSITGLQNITKIPFTTKYELRETDVIGVEMPDHPGELARIIALFRVEDVGIEYLYASHEHKEDKAVIVLKVDNVEAGLAMLTKHGCATIRSF